MRCITIFLSAFNVVVVCVHEKNGVLCLSFLMLLSLQCLLLKKYLGKFNHFFIDFEARNCVSNPSKHKTFI